MSKTLIVSMFGFMSGFTILITGNTLNFWFTKYGVSKELIGLLSAVAMPYSINFLWAPIFDKVKIPFLNKKFGIRTSWLILLCALSFLSVLTTSFFSPVNDIRKITFLTFLSSLLLSSKDSILGAIRSEYLTREEQLSTSGVYVLSYRTGMFFSGSIAIFTSRFVSWNVIYLCFSIVILLFCIFLIRVSDLLKNNSCDKKSIDKAKKYSNDLTNNSYGFIFRIFIFLFLYRISDNFIATMINPFLFEKGFNEMEISLYSKFVGTVGSILGGFLAAKLSAKKITRCLFNFGILHVLGHSFLIIQSAFEKNITLLLFGVLAESITGGICMSLYVSFITSLCQGKNRVTQYSVLSSIMGFSRSVAPTITGFIAVKYGWTSFFLICFFISIPSIIMIYHIDKKYARN